MSGKKIRVTLIKSPYGTGKRHIACVRGLGLRRLHHTRDVEDTPAVRGMIREVAYMVRIREI
jgi:large subunit ribosomal protein L30